MATWTLDDNTYGKKSGFLTIKKDGCRVADCFPFSAGVDPEWIKAEAQRIVDTMNAAG